MKIRKVLFIIIAALFFNMPVYLKAITEFPSEIVVNKGGLINKYGWNIYNKSYSAGTSSGKAFCASFHNLAPENNTVCSKTNWANDKEINEKASAAIGYLINSLRNSDMSISTDNYFYGELAINDFLYNGFLYNEKLGGEVNNVNSIPTEIKNVIKPYVNKMSQIYNNYYNKDYVEITEVKFNNEKIQNSSSVNRNSNRNIIKITMKCMDKTDGKQIKCDLPKSDGKLYVNRIPVEINDNSVKSIMYSGNYIIITYDITDYLKNNSSDVTVKLNVSNRRLHHYAQRYSCNRNSTNNQTITPNYLKIDYSGLKYKSFQFTISSSSIPSSDTCESEISSNPVSNAGLYGKNEKYGAHLLDIKNPSCDGTINNSNISCDEASFSNEWVEDISINGKGYKALCKASFAFDNLVSDQNVSQSGNLIYKPSVTYDIEKKVTSESWMFGRATLSYDCNIPALYSTTDSTSHNYELSIEKIVPKITLSIFNKNYNISGTVNPESISDNCNINSNQIICKNYNEYGGIGFGFSFSSQINYKYTNDYKYTISSNGKVSKNGSDEPLYGYGIPVPSNTKSGEYKNGTTISFDVGSTVFDGANNSVSCDYVIDNDDIRNKINYRTIDVDKPFSKSNGDTRYTGSNWCERGSESTILERNSDIVNSEALKDINYDCIYLWDVNKNYRWDNDDAILLQAYSAKYITSLSDDGSSREDIQKYLEEAKIADDNNDRRAQAEAFSKITLPRKYMRFRAGSNNKLEEFAVSQVKNIVAFKNKYSVGDINMDGFVDTNDINVLRQYLENKIEITFVQQKLANIDNSDGMCIVDNNDLTALQNLFNANTGVSDNSVNYNYEGLESPLQSFENDIRENVLKQICSGDSNSNSTVKEYIANRPNANSKDTPLYSFKLNANDIKNIREYNKNVDYSNQSDNFIKDLLTTKMYSNDYSGKCVDEYKNNGYCDISAVLSKKESS